MASILLLEDNYNLLRLYTKFLTANNHTVEAVMAVESALDVFDQSNFDLIISDLRLGAYSIERLIKRLKQIQNVNQVPVLVISAHLDTYQDLCIESGLKNALSKPFGKRELTSVVDKILNSQESIGS